ncbi:cryptic autophosphorylating protein tyrosine kinase Etk [Roseovarius litorisediminis]|uniref:Cryptic autophosphorylating protein tyrosine kinase Etk n=1 Tax=Roseovarius litorisediminis TaxID=1312363 RepID=A0A1Y5SRY0_9RHOB|nr:Wzz/FepE/Etk N-terminal domain-containing protein [Roseovarius litorisediminis]SLN46921.1 cryptic autophosphorylating protein tyrosine kinase Etk [Roseovarius litorisediminis]
MSIDLKFYLAVFMRRLHYFLLVALAVAGVGLTIAYTLPPTYKANATLLVESAQIPGNLAESTVQVEAAEFLQIIRQRILTRAKLLEISRKFNVFPNALEMSADDIVEGMRRRISMSLPRRNDVASFVTVSFEASKGRLSAEVTNELVTLILEENLALRTAASGQTLAFFEREVARLNLELADRGDAILKFKMENKDALPDSLDFRRNSQKSLQERVLNIDRELLSLRDRKSRLQQLYDQTGRVAGSGNARMDPDVARLLELQDQLAYALTLYSEQNPKVKNLRIQIEAMENKIGKLTDSLSEENPGITAFDLQVLDINGQIDFLADQKKNVEQELANLAKSIDATPANAVQLGSLERDYENLRIQYNQATADLAKARTGDQIEAQSRGQRISVIEQAVVPNEPTDPNRKSIAFASIILALVSGFGFIALLEFFNRSVRRPVDLTKSLGIAPLVTIPYIFTSRQVLARRALILSALLVVTIMIPAGIYMLHLYVMPIDMMVDKVLTKSGLSDLLEKLGLKVG